MTVIDLAFPLREAVVPADHGYALYGALSRSVQAFHGAEWLGVHPLSGKPIGEGQLRVGGASGLRLRLPAEHIGSCLPLVGASLDVAGAQLVVGAPTVHALVPAASLDARLVTVSLTEVPNRDNPALGRKSLDREAIAKRTHEELVRQLVRLGVEGAELRLAGHGRMTVAARRVIGFSVRVSGLSADASIALQAHGLGGKRRMGCGIFRPTRGR